MSAPQLIDKEQKYFLRHFSVPSARTTQVPVYCPHLNPIERMWGVMHAYVTHNKCYATRKEFCEAILEFLNHTACAAKRNRKPA